MNQWNIEDEAMDLKEYGINNFAFDLPSAIVYMCEAVYNGKKILGGDIIVFENGQWTESCDNWYSTKVTPCETLKDAITYLNLYWKRSYIDPFCWKVTIILED